jgi:hypothetical protein
MADKYPLANGNWSTAVNWNDGTKPIAGDDVYADGKTVTIDEDFTVASVRVTQRSGGTSGGTFNISSNRILTANGLGFTSLISGSPICLNVLSGCSTLTLNGNLQAGGNSGTCVAISTAAIVTINGNITGGNGTGHGVSITAGATLNVTGNVTGGTATGAGINNTTVAATINITGNVTSQVSAGILSTIASVVTVKGIITSSNTIAGVSLSSTSVSFTFSGTAINSSNGVMAIYCPNIKLYNDNANTVEWRFRDELGNVKTLYSAGLVLGNPVITNVRSGITYGTSLELTGTMIVPSPSDVRISVPTDNTVGTGQLTAADFLAAISSSLDPIAVRLKNVSTVDTTGAQMASYNI